MDNQMRLGPDETWTGLDYLHQAQLYPVEAYHAPDRRWLFRDYKGCDAGIFCLPSVGCMGQTIDRSRQIRSVEVTSLSDLLKRNNYRR